MQIQLNGQTIETQAQTVSELLQEQQIDASCVATALNGNFVPRSAYPHQSLAAGCQLEVLSPMQGG
ncbi:MAG: thiamine biosynthesis protein sulfur carrier ThiS [Pantoea eucrina]|jgi:sulfur carrier protein|uniref:sulfur carrier protein ThiS n=1 Tax=Pantoea TaxID=53335 RepID=UPI00080F4A15|nr:MULTISPECIES: sulfur carrier protein ThiS [Pantoea]MDF2783666.1 thiamine biosynthesis protein sulfur carrier ThiS [Pantoea eucrina]